MTRSPSDIDHLSASSIALYMECPRHWAAHYLDEREQRQGGALIKGKAVDAAATANWAQKPKSGRDMSIEDAEGVAEEAFYEEVDAAGGRDSVDWRDSNFGAELDSAIRLTRRHMLDHAPLHTPVAVQRRFTKRLPGTERDIIGYVDAVLTEDGSEVWDVKTSARRMSQGDANTNIQASTYIWAAGKAGTFHFGRLIHSRYRAGVSSEVVTTHRTEAQNAAYEAQAVAISGLIDDTVFPRQPGYWCGWCPINNTCPVAERRNNG